jgi:excisionase family DNA binding protein
VGKLLLIRELAKRLKVHEVTIRRAIADGRLPQPMRVGEYRVWPESQVSAIRRALGPCRRGRRKETARA